MGLLRWLRERVPEKVRKDGDCPTKRRFTNEIREKVVLDLISGEYSIQEICEKYDIGDQLLYH